MRTGLRRKKKKKMGGWGRNQAREQGAQPSAPASHPRPRCRRAEQPGRKRGRALARPEAADCRAADGGWWRSSPACRCRGAGRGDEEQPALPAAAAAGAAGASGAARLGAAGSVARLRQSRQRGGRRGGAGRRVPSVGRAGAGERRGEPRPPSFPLRPGIADRVRAGSGGSGRGVWAGLMSGLAGTVSGSGRRDGRLPQSPASGRTALTAAGRPRGSASIPRETRRQLRGCPASRPSPGREGRRRQPWP